MGILHMKLMRADSAPEPEATRLRAEATEELAMEFIANLVDSGVSPDTVSEVLARLVGAERRESTVGASDIYSFIASDGEHSIERAGLTYAEMVAQHGNLAACGYLVSVLNDTTGVPVDSADIPPAYTLG